MQGTHYQSIMLTFLKTFSCLSRVSAFPLFSYLLPCPNPQVRNIMLLRCRKAKKPTRNLKLQIISYLLRSLLEIGIETYPKVFIISLLSRGYNNNNKKTQRYREAIRSKEEEDVLQSRRKNIEIKTRFYLGMPTAHTALKESAKVIKLAIARYYLRKLELQKED